MRSRRSLAVRSVSSGAGPAPMVLASLAFIAFFDFLAVFFATFRVVALSVAAAAFSVGVTAGVPEAVAGALPPGDGEPGLAWASTRPLASASVANRAGTFMVASLL